MGALRYLLALATLAARRLWSNLGLMAGTAAGLIVAVALVMSIPLYTGGVNYRLLQSALGNQPGGRIRPPFAFMFRYVGAWHGAVDWQDLEAAEAFFAQQCPGLIGLPLELSVRHVKTDNLRLYPAEGSGYDDPRRAMDWIALGFVSNLAGHVTFVEGGAPQVAPAGGDEPIEVVVHETKANEFGLQVGEQFILMGTGEPALQVPVKVAGIWRPEDPGDPFWFYAPEALDNVFLMAESSFANRLGPARKPVYLALWYLVFDGRGMHTEEVPGFLGRIVAARTMASTALANTSLDASPADALVAYTAAARLLTILLYVFAIPIVGLILYFIVMTSGLAVQRQRNEIAVLRSRGASSAQIVGLYLLEGLILGLLAMGLGPLLGKGLAVVMGRARSFLTFAPGEEMVVSFSRQSLRVGLGAVLVSLGASLVPALGAARHTIVTYKHDVARSLARPWWQRLYLDFLLLAVPLYGYYLLRQRGTISFLGRTVSAAEGDPFRNPLLFLVPTLFVFALALVFLRLFPLLMEALARLAEAVPEASPLLALRQLARSSRQYSGPLMLIVLTLGLACFTASMAETLDRGLVDQVYYQVGADVRLVETGETNVPAGADGMPAGLGGPAGQSTAKEEEPLIWYFLPVSEHLKVKGVLGAARLGSFRVSARVGGTEESGTLLGIDRADFQRVAFFRRDMAPASLGSLLNRLAVDGSAVLVSRSFLGAHGLSVGDELTLHVTGLVPRKEFEVPLVIAGVSDLFPTVYPEDGPFFVANLDYVFDCLGGEYPYDVLLRTAPGANTRRIVADLQGLGLHVLNAYDARAMVAGERLRPERQGILGLLSVGFLASAVLTVLGFLIYSFLSFRRRFIELGILRAIGLSVTQMAAFLGLEQLTLIVVGMAAGTGLGVWASYLFIPFLQVRAGPHPQTPPFVVEIAWGDIAMVAAIFGAMLLCAVAGLVWLLLRMRIAQAVKLGEVA